MIQDFSATLNIQKSRDIGQSETNQNRNRFIDIIPFDDNYVSLSSEQAEMTIGIFAFRLMKKLGRRPRFDYFRFIQQVNQSNQSESVPPLLETLFNQLELFLFIQIMQEPLGRRQRYLIGKGL